MCIYEVPNWRTLKITSKRIIDIIVPRVYGTSTPFRAWGDWTISVPLPLHTYHSPARQPASCKLKCFVRPHSPALLDTAHSDKQAYQQSNLSWLALLKVDTPQYIAYIASFTPKPLFDQNADRQWESGCPIMEANTGKSPKVTSQTKQNRRAGTATSFSKQHMTSSHPQKFLASFHGYAPCSLVMLTNGLKWLKQRWNGLQMTCSNASLSLCSKNRHNSSKLFSFRWWLRGRILRLPELGCQWGHRFLRLQLCYSGSPRTYAVWQYIFWVNWLKETSLCNTLYIYHWNKRKNNQHIFNPSNNCGIEWAPEFSWGQPYWMQRTNAILSHVKESCARWHFSAWHPSSGLHVSEASIGYIRSKHRLIHWLLWVDWVVSTTCLQNLQMSTILLDDTGWKKKVSIVQNTPASRGSQRSLASFPTLAPCHAGIRFICDDPASSSSRAV